MNEEGVERSLAKIQAELAPEGFGSDHEEQLVVDAAHSAEATVSNVGEVVVAPGPAQP